MFLALLAVGWAVLEGGYRLGRWRHLRSADEKDAPVGAMVAAVLGLVAFMLAFTFGLAAQRFDLKRQVVLDEANAIGTTYLRTRMLPAPQKMEIAHLLREYVDLRVDAAARGGLGDAGEKSEKLQEAIWQQAVAVSDKDRTPIAALFVDSLNQMIDLHSTRSQTELRSRIPLVIWIVLYSLSALGVAAMGYQAGLSATRRSPAMMALVIAFTGVLFLIVDLDRSNAGFLMVDQTAMTDLQRSMHATETP
ncbi:MAG TPA: hypothetical protein VG056_09295 [Pirellulales bacterium]|jgi:hypothetical protein|nr:hypothetical protein [Pirellulales bacterium]